MQYSCSDDYEDAVAKCEKLRALPPAVYNQARVLEQPIPNIEQPVPECSNAATETLNPDHIGITDFGGDDVNIETNCDDGVADTRGADALVENTTIEVAGNEGAIGTTEMERNENCDVLVKEEPTNELNANDFEQILQIMDDEYEVDNDPVTNAPLGEIPLVTQPIAVEESNADESKGDSGILISFDGEEFPQPIRATEDGLIKRDNDEVSGNLPFAERVSGFSHILNIYCSQTNFIHNKYIYFHRKMVIAYTELATSKRLFHD